MNARREDASLVSAIAADPLASLRVNAPAMADLAFGSLSVDITRIEGGHLALLPTDALELDLNDPLQRQFGDYELNELIGEGGMGVVYRAHQRSLDREVAVKLLAAGPWASKDFIERFRREAQNAARMQHPNIVTIYEVGSAEELHFFSMQLIHGPSLSSELRREKRFASRRAATLVRVIAEAVDYAHRLGVLHLDLKPANVLIDENGTPHVADFGLARRLEHGLAPDSDEVSGTPSYMAPEQAQGKSKLISPATDIWGLGAILYELVTGQPPFLGESPQATLRLVVEGTLRRPREHVPHLPRDLEAILAKCMAPGVAQRYPSARALADDLAAFVEGHAVAARPLNVFQRATRWARREPKLAGTAALALLALLVGLTATTQQWRRAERNTAASNNLLWESRHEAALRLQKDGRGFQALAPLIANIEEREAAGGSAVVERREAGTILRQGVVLIDRMHLPDADQASPFAVSVSADASRFAIAMTDLTVHWYNTKTHAELGHVDLLGLPTSTNRPENPELLRFIDNHRLVVTMEWTDIAPSPAPYNSYLIDLDAAQVVEFPEGFPGVSSASFSADGKYALLQNTKQEIQFWQVQPWHALAAAFKQGPDEETMLIDSDAEHLIGIGMAAQSLTFYESRTANERRTRIALPVNQSISAWAESPDAKLFAFGNVRGGLWVFDKATKALRQLPTPFGSVATTVAFSDDGAWLAMGRKDGAVYAFDVASGDPINTGEMQAGFELQRVFIDRSQRLLIAGGLAGPLGMSALWRLPQLDQTGLPATRVVTSPMRPATAGPYSMAFSAQTGLIVSADTDGEVRFWRAPPSPVREAHAARQLPGNLEFDGQHLIDVEYNKLRIDDGGGGASGWQEFPQPLGFAELIDAARTVVVTSGAQLHVLDAATMRPRYSPVDLGNSPLRLAANAASNTVVVSFPEKADAGFSERLESFDLRDGHRQGRSVVLPGPLRQFEFAPDGKRLLVVGAASQPTRVFDPPTLKQLGEYSPAEAAPVIWGSFIAGSDSLFLLTRRVDDPRIRRGQVLLWNPAKAEPLQTRTITESLPAGVIAVGERPFVAGQEFDWLDAGGVGERRMPAPTSQETTATLALSHDGRLVAHAFRFGVQVYDAQTGAFVGPLLNADLVSADVIAQLVFAPDDSRLLARTLEGRWLLWPIAFDNRSVADLRKDSDLLNASSNQSLPKESTTGSASPDPGPWPAADQRPRIAVTANAHGMLIPARAADASSFLLDLTEAYNTAPSTHAGLYVNMIATMAGLPLGIVRIDGIDYDIRGAIQLYSFGVRRAGVEFAQHADGIAVPPAPIAAFHVLVLRDDVNPASDTSTREQARLAIHYRDGTSASVPLRSGSELSSKVDNRQGAPLGWSWSDLQRLMGFIPPDGINNPRLPNPHPESPIATIDIEVDENAEYDMTFFAVTAEPVISAGNSGTTTPSGAGLNENQGAQGRQP
jgi:WD40 repeat protein